VEASTYTSRHGIYPYRSLVPTRSNSNCVITLPKPNARLHIEKHHRTCFCDQVARMLRIAFLRCALRTRCLTKILVILFRMLSWYLKFLIPSKQRTVYHMAKTHRDQECWNRFTSQLFCLIPGMCQNTFWLSSSADHPFSHCPPFVPRLFLSLIRIGMMSRQWSCPF